MSKLKHEGAARPVVVIGGGPSGLAASITAARNGADVILVERYGFLGGMATAGMVPHFNGFCTEVTGKQIIMGFAQELVEKLMEAGGSSGYLPRPTCPVGSVMVPFHPDILKYVAVGLAREAGVRLLLHSFFTHAEVDNRTIKKLYIQTKSGEKIIEPATVIDCTGDGDVAARCGAPYEKHEKLQPMNLMMTVGDVRWEKTIQYMKENPYEFHWGIDRPTKPEKLNNKTATAAGFYSIVEEAQSNGDLYSTIDRIILHRTGRDSEIECQMIRVVGYDGSKVEDLSDAEVEGINQVMQAVSFLKKYIPGFEECHLIRTAPQIAVRETRRIQGEYQITAEDVRMGRAFSDAILKVGMAIDVHNPGKGFEFYMIKNNDTYDVPYRSLLPKGVENLLVAGRCISGDHIAHGSYRQMAPCMGLGEAAGTAAALAISLKKPVRSISVSDLQETLKKQNVYLGQIEPIPRIPKELLE